MTATMPPADTSTHDAQREQNPWTTLGQIWHSEYPPEAPSPRSFSLVVKLVVTPILLVRRLSPTTWVRNRGANTIDAMVVTLTIATALILVCPGIRRPFPVCIVVAWAYFRIGDVATQKLMEILIHSVRPPEQESIQRTLLLSAFNVYEIIASYAIIYLLNGGVKQSEMALAGATDAFYFSTITALTVGYGDFLPTTEATRRLVVSQIFVVALFIVAWFPVAVSLLFPRDSAMMSSGPRSNERRV